MLGLASAREIASEGRRGGYNLQMQRNLLGSLPVVEPPPRAKATGKARAVLAIEGMHCAACTARIERALDAVPGVAGAMVNLATAEAAVEYDPDRVDLAKMAAAVQGAGYKARPLVDASPLELGQRQAREATEWRRRLIAGLAMLLPLVVLHYGIAGHTAMSNVLTGVAAAIVQG